MSTSTASCTRALVRSPFAHARVLAVDAAAVPPAASSLLPDDVRGLAGYGVQIEDETVLALDRVRLRR